MPIRIAFSYQPYKDNNDVLHRMHTRFKPAAKHIGRMSVIPSVQSALLFNDNIYARASNRQSDWVTDIRPSVIFYSDTKKDTGLRATLYSHHGLYAQRTNENFHDMGFSIAPYKRLSKRSTVKAYISHQRLHEMRTDEGAAFNQTGSEPVQYQQSTGSIGWQHRYNNIRTDWNAEIRTLRYENISDFTGINRLINDDRDRIENEISFQARYTPIEKTEFGWRLSGTVYDYQNQDYSTVTTSYSGFDRDSKSVESTLYFKMPITPLIHAEIKGGIHHRSFDDGAFRNYTKPVGSVDIVWNITPLISLYTQAHRSVYETRNRNASTFTQDHYRFHAAYELKRDVVLEASWQEGTHDYTDDIRKDDFQSIQFAANYTMNRHIIWRASYEVDHRKSNIANNDFDRQRASIGVHIRF